MSMKPSAQEKPETLRQASSWVTVNRLAHDFGELCWKCSAQIAWAAQLGYGQTTHGPCVDCAAIVDRFPVEQKNGWRSPDGRLSEYATWEEVAIALRKARVGVGEAASTLLGPTEPAPRINPEAYKRGRAMGAAARRHGREDLAQQFVGVDGPYAQGFRETYELTT